MPAISDPSFGFDQPFVLGPRVSILGRFESPGQAIVQGHFEGELIAEKVLVASGGSISGTIVAAEVIVEGHSDSLIYADKIALRSGCYVTGELYHAELKLEPGADFEGKSRRFLNPQSLAREAATFL